MKRKPGGVLKSWFLFGGRAGPFKDFANLTLTGESAAEYRDRRAGARLARRPRQPANAFSNHSEKTMAGPLSGIRVLDLTSVLFGPYAAQMLGDWGADVIKVEPPTGDTWRYTGVFRNRGMSGQFMAVNRNKRSLALDLKHPDGKAALARLIPTVDALVTNVRAAPN